MTNENAINDEIVGATVGDMPASTTEGEGESPPPAPPKPGAVEEAEAKARRAEAEARRTALEVEKIKLRKDKSATRETPLSKFIGSTEAIKVWKVQDDGKRDYINRYRWSEVKNFKDLESFIDMRLRDSMGDGDYEVVLIDKNGQDGAPIQVTMARPITGRGSPAQQVTPKDIVQIQREAREEALREQERADARIKELMEKAKSEGGNAAAFMAPMLEVVRDSQRQMMSLMERKLSTPTTIPKPPESGSSNEVLIAFMREARDRESKLEIEREKIRSEEQKFRLQLEEDRRRHEADRHQKEMEFQKTIEEWRKEEREKERAHQKELMSLQLTNKKDPLEEFLKFEDARRKLEENFKGETSWTDVAATFAEGLPDLAGRIAEAVQGAKPPVTPPVQRQMAGLPAASGTEGAEEEGEEEGEGEEQKVQLALPKGFEEHKEKMAKAESDAEVIEAVVNALVFLAQSKVWNAHVNNLLGLVARKKKRRTLKELHEFLDVLTELDAMEDDTAERIEKALDSNWDVITQVVDARIKEAMKSRRKK